MRILVVCRELPPIGGGAGAVALDLARALVSTGNSVHILTMHFGDLPESDEIDGVGVTRLRCGRRDQDSAYLGSMLRFVREARHEGRRMAASERFDLVHAHAIVPDGLAARSIARVAGLPLVITAHGTDVPGYDPGRYAMLHRALRPVWNRVVRDTDLLTTPSQYLADLIGRRSVETPVTVIPNGIDVGLLSADRSDRDGFLIVSRLIERKGYHRFFEALRLVEEPVRVDVVGDGPQRPRLEALAGGSPHTVRFHGWLEHGSAEWRRLYETSRFFVFPSSNENFPINLMEAQLAGLTVLASDIPGSREVLGEHAIYLDDLTPAPFAATIQAAIRSGAALEQVGFAAAARVRGQFAWPMVAARFADEFRRVLEARDDR